MAILKSSIAFALAAALIFSVARACEDQPELDQQCRRLPDTHPDYDLVTCVECSLTCGGSLTPTCVSVHACGWCTNYPRTTLPPSTVTGPTGTSSMQPGETSSNGTIGRWLTQIGFCFNNVCIEIVDELSILLHLQALYSHALSEA